MQVGGRVLSGTLGRQRGTARPIAAAFGCELEIDPRWNDYDSDDIPEHHSATAARLQPHYRYCGHHAGGVWMDGGDADLVQRAGAPAHAGSVVGDIPMSDGAEPQSSIRKPSLIVT